MVQVTAYDSWEQAQADMAAREDEANEALSGAQQQVRDCDEQQFVVALEPSEELLLYGSIPPPEDIELRDRGYLTGTWYSRYEPDGEMGDNHALLVLFSIPPSAFEDAKELGWPDLDEIRSLGMQVPAYAKLAKKLAFAERTARMHG